MTTKRSIASVCASLALVACGSSSSSSDADVMFAQMMIPHHEQAIELSDLALNPATGASEAIKQLATQIKGNQDPEIAFMAAWLEERNESSTADEGIDHSSMMSGMLSLEDLDALRLLIGTEFDQAWIAAMIAHHEGAIEMAQRVQRDGDDDDIAALAADIIAAQAAEIEILQGL